MAKAISADIFATRLHAALGGRLVSLLLYGSAARGTHVPGRSDVNTLLICDAVDEPLADLAAHAMGAVQLTLKAADPRAVAYLTAVARTAEFVDHL